MSIHFVRIQVYIRENLPVVIYDFSVTEDKFDARSKAVTIYVSPGIKIIPNRTVLSVYKTVMDNWSRIQAMDENKEWARAMGAIPGLGASTNINSLFYSYSAEIGLYDDYGDRIASFRWYGASPSLGLRYNRSFQVLAQQKYYNEKEFGKILFTVPLDKITETITPKIERVYYSFGPHYKPEEIDYPVYTVVEWQEWLLQQGAER
jgi:hypothetical protein